MRGGGTATSADSVPGMEGPPAVAQLTPSPPAIGATIRIIKVEKKTLKNHLLGWTAFSAFLFERVYYFSPGSERSPCLRKTTLAVKILHLTDGETEAERGESGRSSQTTGALKRRLVSGNSGLHAWPWPRLVPPRFSADPESPPGGVASPSPGDVAGGPDSDTQGTDGLGRSEGLRSREDAHPGLTPRNSGAWWLS